MVRYQVSKNMSWVRWCSSQGWSTSIYMCCPIPTLPSSSFESRSTIGISEGPRRKSRRSPSQREFQLWPFVASDFCWSKIFVVDLLRCSLDIFVGTCMMYAICHVYILRILWPNLKSTSVFRQIGHPRHPTVEIHNSYIKFHTIIWSASVHQHSLSFLAADFARNKEKETFQNQKSLKGPEGYPNILSCVMLHQYPALENISAVAQREWHHGP